MNLKEIVTVTKFKRVNVSDILVDFVVFGESSACVCDFEAGKVVCVLEMCP